MKNTREIIIKSAFSFYTRPVFSNVSLSMIASKAGITKAAIYRHFKSRDDLDNAMYNCVYEDLFGILKNFRAEKASNDSSIVEDIIVLLMTHREYVYYLISTCNDIVLDRFLLKFKEMGLSLFDDIFLPDGSVKDMEVYKDAVYMACNIIYFQLVRNKMFDCMGMEDRYSDITIYASKLYAFIKKGLGQDVSELSAFRLASLDKMCMTSMEGVAPVNKVFESVASIVEEKGFQGVTVESVARGIGLAKSSIYSKFENKAQMIASLIHKEFEQMFEILNRNIQKAKSNGERAYIMMETELLYFMKKPELFTVGQWLQFQNTEEIVHDDCEHERVFNTYLDQIKLYEVYPDLGLPQEDFKIIASWFLMMPVFLYMHTRKQNMAPEVVQGALKDIFFMMEKGF
ncbi:MAG: TetR/AcrR family transcriptional regulator [Treponema sp.]|nr:TetR/AcrR family transcriptional regulator [Candidatus Treponema equi]